MTRLWISTLFLLAVMAFMAWATGFVTLQGECTVYTVGCKDGRWEGERCTGSLVAGERYRFRALKPHREVLYWTVGASAPSGRYADCEIEDGRNWKCRVSGEAPKTITLALVHGDPVQDAAPSTAPLRSVQKLRWLLLRSGLPAGHTADTPVAG